MKIENTKKPKQKVSERTMTLVFNQFFLFYLVCGGLVCFVLRLHSLA